MFWYRCFGISGSHFSQSDISFQKMVCESWILHLLMHRCELGHKSEQFSFFHSPRRNITLHSSHSCKHRSTSRPTLLAVTSQMSFIWKTDITTGSHSQLQSNTAAWSAVLSFKSWHSAYTSSISFTPERLHGQVINNKYATSSWTY